jgi:uncharacterized protein
MFSATDISTFLASEHTATLKRAESRNEIRKPFFADPAIDLLRELGLEHERRYLRTLAANKLSIAKITSDGPWSAAIQQTIAALRKGTDVVYQGAFLDGEWGGRPDFLTRVDRASELGDWSYEPVETKLARSTKAGALVQLCLYSELLSRIQGTEPQRMHIVLGGGAAPEKFTVQRYTAYVRKIRSEFEDAWRLESETYPEPNEHCDVCSWLPMCDKRWRDDDHLSLVAGVSRNQRKALVERGIETVAQLGSLALPLKSKIERIGDAELLRIREQARLQVQGRQEGRLIYELLEPVEPGKGLSALPPPSPPTSFWTWSPTRTCWSTARST